MRTLRIILAAFCLALTARGADFRIKATVTITNLPVTGDTFNLNGNVRTWTNASTFPVTFIKTDTTIGGSATNAYNAFAQTGFSGSVVLGFTPSNTITLLGALNESMSVTLSTAYAAVSYSTNLSTNQTPVLVPISAYQSGVTQTNVPTQLVAGLNTYAKTNFSVGLLPHNFGTDVFSNGVVFNATLTNCTLTNCIFSNGVAYGTVVNHGFFTNPTTSAGLFFNPISSNLINLGNAISSPGSGALSENFGSSAIAAGSSSTAVGYSAFAQADYSVAVGQGTVASNIASIAIGKQAFADGDSSIAIGSGSGATGDNGLALGTGAGANTNSTAIGVNAFTGVYTNSTALGYGATSTANFQIMLGSPGISTVVNNNFTVGGNVGVTGVITNITSDGTNYARGSISYQRVDNSALANGNNADVATGKSVYLNVSGPSGAFSIAGFAGGNDGRMVIVQNNTGQTLTVLNQSGVDATPANRVITGINASLVITNIPSFVEMLYDASQSRWVVVNHSF